MYGMSRASRIVAVRSNSSCGSIGDHNPSGEFALYLLGGKFRMLCADPCARHLAGSSPQFESEHETLFTGHPAECAHVLLERRTISVILSRDDDSHFR